MHECLELFRNERAAPQVSASRGLRRYSETQTMLVLESSGRRAWNRQEFVGRREELGPESQSGRDQLPDDLFVEGVAGHRNAVGADDAFARPSTPPFGRTDAQNRSRPAAAEVADLDQLLPDFEASARSCTRPPPAVLEHDVRVIRRARWRPAAVPARTRRLRRRGRSKNEPGRPTMTRDGVGAHRWHRAASDARWSDTRTTRPALRRNTYVLSKRRLQQDERLVARAAT